MIYCYKCLTAFSISFLPMTFECLVYLQYCNVTYIRCNNNYAIIHIHAYISSTYTHTSVPHTRIHTYISSTCTHTHIHQFHMHTYTHTPVPHTHIHAYISSTCTHTSVPHAHIHVHQFHMHTYTHTSVPHAHIHTYISSTCTHTSVPHAHIHTYISSTCTHTCTLYTHTSVPHTYILQLTMSSLDSSASDRRAPSLNDLQCLYITLDTGSYRTFLHNYIGKSMAILGYMYIHTKTVLDILDTGSYRTFFLLKFRGYTTIHV